MKDIRTPDSYFDKPESLDAKIKRLNGKLDDLVAAIEKHKNKSRVTPAEKRIIETEEEKADRLLYKKISNHYAKKVVEAFIFGNQADATNAIGNALDFKCTYRIEPTLINTASEIENQVFR